MVERDSNCIGYTYWALGLLEQEEVLYPESLSAYTKDFEIVETAEDADAVTIIADHPEGAFPVHMAIIDSQDRSYVFQRRRRGSPVTHELLDEVLQDYLSIKDTVLYRAVFLKKRGEENPESIG